METAFEQRSWSLAPQLAGLSPAFRVRSLTCALKTVSQREPLAPTKNSRSLYQPPGVAQAISPDRGFNIAGGGDIPVLAGDYYPRYGIDVNQPRLGLDPDQVALF